jgi:segregation and condensation protein B
MCGDDDGRMEMDGEAAAEEGNDVVDFGTPEAVLLSRLESLIFTSPEPMSVRKLARILSLEGKAVRALADKLMAHYQDRGVILEEISQGYQFRSHPDNAAMLRDVFKLKPIRMSRAALEALAIVAYRQPLTRAEVEEIRGVDSGGVLKYLFEKELVRVIGRKEEPGRPIIYGTSKAFLELFGLKSLSDLPALHEFSELWEEHQKLVDEEAPLADDVVENDDEANVADERREAAPSGRTDASEEQSEMDDKKDAREDAQKASEKQADPNDVTTETLDQEELDAIIKKVASVEDVEDEAEAEEGVKAGEGAESSPANGEGADD